MSQYRLNLFSWLARAPAALVFFVAIFSLIAHGSVWAIGDLPRHVSSIGLQEGKTRMASNDRTPGAPISYFSDRMPGDVGFPAVPEGATGVVVAKVRLEDGPVYLGGRNRPGRPSENLGPENLGPENLRKDIFFARLKISEVLSGDASVGQMFEVYFGARGGKRRFTYPSTPAQQSREYEVVMYLDATDGQRRLAPFSITELQYSQWENEKWEYTRLRGKAGYRE